MLHLKKIVGSESFQTAKLLLKEKKKKWQNSMQFTTLKKGNFFGWNRKPYRSKRGGGMVISTRRPRTYSSQ